MGLIQSKCLRLRFRNDCITNNRKRSGVYLVGVNSWGGEKYREPKAWGLKGLPMIIWKLLRMKTEVMSL